MSRAARPPMILGILLATFAFAGCAEEPADDSPGDDGNGNGGQASQTSSQEIKPQAPADRPPRLAIGNSFTDRNRDVGSGEEWTSTQVVEAQESISVRGESRTAYRVKETDARQGGAETTLMWVNEDATEIYRLAFEDLQMDFDPPCRDPTWPLEVGRSFSGLCRGYVMVEGQEVQATMTIEGSIQSKEDVTVPAGTFSSYKVVTTTEFDVGGGVSFSTTSTDFFAPDACGGIVKGSSVDSDGARETYEAMSFTCK